MQPLLSPQQQLHGLLQQLIAACFLLYVDSGLAFVTTAELSQKTAHSSTSRTPIMRSLCRSPLIISIETRIVNNSEPYIEASTEFCRFKNHMIGAQFTNIKIPECYFLVSLHPAWSAAGVFKASHNNVFAMWRRNISRMCFCRIGIELDQLHSTNLPP